jgi:aminoglycoside phosphotransferase (APT) family kinase protein
MPAPDELPLIGRGRAADVYALGVDRVVRRYRTPISLDVEATLMDYLWHRGFPVPRVFHVDGAAMIMERLHGPTMLTQLGRQPGRLRGYADALADLHRRLHAIPAPVSLRQAFGADRQVLHLDLHPGNVMLTDRGPVVIDWTNAAAGSPGADVAHTVMLMSTGDVDTKSRWQWLVTSALRGPFVRRFVAVAGEDMRPYVRAVAEARLTDPNVRPTEVTRLHRLLAKSTGQP